MQEARGNASLLVSGIVAAVVAICGVLFWPLTVVDAGHSGVVRLFGKVQEVPLESGLHIINPLSSVQEMDIRQKHISVTGEVGTKDLQSVHAVVVVNYHPTAVGVSKLYSQFGLNYVEVIANRAAIEDRMKSITGKYDAADLIHKRTEVSAKIKSAVRDVITERSGGLLVVDDVVVKDFGFAASFMKAIEEKQVADQQAQKAERDLARIKVEAEQQVVTAKASAEAFRVQSQQLTPAMIQMEAIKKWDGTMPTFLGGGSLPFVTIPGPKQ
jgi:prohibitin 2